MPYTEIAGTRIFYVDTGKPHLPPLLCLHSLSFDHRMFAAQLKDFGGRFRVIRPDFRGQGRSIAPGRGAISIETCADDIRRLLDKLQLSEVHIFAQSMGGDVALRLAINHPSRVASLILAGASACAEDPANVSRFRLSQHLVSLFGARSVLRPTLAIMFGATFRHDPARRHEFSLWSKRLAGRPRRLHRAIAGVIDRASVESSLNRIAAPTLIFSGEEDVARPPEWSRAMAAGIQTARLIPLPGVGHSPAIEASETINPQIEAFLNAVTGGEL